MGSELVESGLTLLWPGILFFFFLDSWPCFITSSLSIPSCSGTTFRDHDFSHGSRFAMAKCFDTPIQDYS